MPSVRQFLSGIFAVALALLPVGQAGAAEPVAEKTTRAKVVVIPIRAQIAKPELYILRRGLKEAIEQKADTIILEGIFGFDPYTTMPAAAEATVKAAERLYGKSVAKTVSRVFQARGILQ